jgi:DNA-binding response OmpR family regulator
MTTPFGRPATQPAILVVDHDQNHVRHVASCLGAHFRVLPVSSMGHALPLIREVRPVVVLLELDLPDGDGLRLLRAIHQDPATYPVIVACVTHRASVRDKIAGFQAGADDYLVKPIDPATFLRHVLLLTHFHRPEF